MANEDRPAHRLGPLVPEVFGDCLAGCPGQRQAVHEMRLGASDPDCSVPPINVLDAQLDHFRTAKAKIGDASDHGIGPSTRW